MDLSSDSTKQLLLRLTIEGVLSIALIIILSLLKRLSTKSAKGIERARHQKIRPIKFNGFEIVDVDRIVRLLLSLLNYLRAIFALILVYGYLLATLWLFPWTEHLVPHLHNIIVPPVLALGGMGMRFLPNLLSILLISFVFRYVLKLVHAFFSEIEVGNLSFPNFHSEWAQPTYKLLRVLILAFALIVIFPHLPGSGTPAFQGVSVFLGVLISLGSSSAVTNMVSGIVITYMRPFKLGDRVRIANTEGDIIEKSLLVTRVRTIKNVDVTIPNSMILGSHLMNFSSSSEKEGKNFPQNTGLLIQVNISIGYNIPWQQVHEILVKAALATPHIQKTPKPFVFQLSLEDFYVTYELNATIRNPELMVDIRSELIQNVLDEFRVAGVEVMSPHFLKLIGTTASEYQRK